MTIKEEIENDIRKAGGSFNIKKGLPELQLTSATKEEYGDLTTNFSFILAGSLKIKPEKATELLKSKIEGKYIEKIEVIGGFLNIWIKDERLYQEIEKLNKNEDFGRLLIGKGKKVLIEFVSANPTGPLHIGHGRGAAYGSSIARILEFSGFSVEREYYVNNVGTQIDLLGESLRARYLNLPIPENGYKGDYLIGIAKEIKEDARNKPLEYFKEFAYSNILSGIKDELLNFGVEFNRFEYESNLYDNRKVSNLLSSLKEHSYVKDDALWLKTSSVSDEKDRVLVRGNERPTYYAGDLAYHKEKFERGYDLLIDLWGTDHHGYIERIKSGLSLMGYNPDMLKIILYQLVTLKRKGELVSMSTRAGEFITLKEVVDEVGRDATRFFLLTKKSDTHLEFDLELAKKESAENPVYYIQYLHARACSILREAEKKNIRRENPDYRLLTLKEEHRLMTHLCLFPDEVKASAIFLEPHRIANYLITLASIFHNYYHHHRVISDDIALTKARLCLINGSRIVAKNGLSLLGISAPCVM
ncbi:MAG: arginine--tRNA ligase [bacterium]